MSAAPEAPSRQPRRERRRMSRMIGRWPEDLRFEDAAVPRELPFRGGGCERSGVWPESSLSAAARVVRGGS